MILLKVGSIEGLSAIVTDSAADGAKLGLSDRETQPERLPTAVAEPLSEADGEPDGLKLRPADRETDAVADSLPDLETEAVAEVDAEGDLSASVICSCTPAPRILTSLINWSARLGDATVAIPPLEPE